MKMNKAIGLLGGLCLLAMAGGPASALVVNLTNDNCGGGCGNGSQVVGTVTIIDTAAGVDFSISPSAGFVFNLAGGGGLNTFEFSVNVALQATDFVGLTAGFTPVLPNGNQDGFGDFTAGVNGSQVILGNTFAGPIQFTVLGIDFDNFIQSTGGGEHVFFAADFKGLVSLNTGLVGSGILRVEENCTNCENPPETPIPGAVWLFGTVLAGGAGYGRWRKKRKQVA